MCNFQTESVRLLSLNQLHEVPLSINFSWNINPVIRTTSINHFHLHSKLFSYCEIYDNRLLHEVLQPQSTPKRKIPAIKQFSVYPPSLFLCGLIERTSKLIALQTHSDAHPNKNQGNPTILIKNPLVFSYKTKVPIRNYTGGRNGCLQNEQIKGKKGAKQIEKNVGCCF